MSSFLNDFGDVLLWLELTLQCIIASAHHIDQIALGEIIYAFGYTGLQILQQIVIADMTTLRYR